MKKYLLLFSMMSLFSIAMCQEYYNVEAIAVPTGGGTVSGGDSYESGSTCTLLAVANSGYSFVNWTLNGTEASTQQEFSFTVEEDVTYIANFEQNETYTITTYPSPTNGGTVTGGGEYASGSTCDLHAVANSGYTFVKWTKNGTQVSTDPDYSFTVTGNGTYIAYFQQSVANYVINAKAEPTNGGTVTGGGQYASESTCTLHAVANSGYAFVKWTKNGTQVSTDPDYSFTVTANASFEAHFEQNVTCYTITATANPTNGGEVTGGGTYTLGSTCTLRAVANSGYSFVKWTLNGTQVSTNPVCILAVTGDVTYVAHFEQNVTYYTITATANPENGGTVTGGGQYASESTCTLHAVANSDYTFVNWTLNGTEVSQNPDYSFTVTANASFVAHFKMNCGIGITTRVEPDNSGTITIDTMYYLDDNKAYITLTAIANENNVFFNWTNDGVDSVLSTNSTESFVLEIENDTVFVAHFVSPEIEPSSFNACNRELCTYVLTGVDMGDDCDYSWTTSDEQAVVISQGNRANIRWGTNGDQTITVRVYRKNVFPPSFASWFDRELTVNVRSEIDQDVVQDTIIVKQKDGNPYLLIYPNKEQTEYLYQWFKDNEPINGANEQYLYEKGNLDSGIYKVYLSNKKDENGNLICGAFSPECRVINMGTVSFSIYPNPSHSGDVIVVKNDSDGDAMLSVYTIDGKLLHNQKMTDGYAEVRINLAHGIYVLRVADSQNVKVEKIIIQ